MQERHTLSTSRMVFGTSPWLKFSSQSLKFVNLGDQWSAGMRAFVTYLQDYSFLLLIMRNSE